MDKDALLKRKADSDTRKVPIGDLGFVLVRGLSRGEVTAAKDDFPEEQRENALIAMALVDPEMTVDEVGQWLDTAPAGDSVAVMTAVAELSGITEGARKSSVPAVRGRQRR